MDAMGPDRHPVRPRPGQRDSVGIAMAPRLPFLSSGRHPLLKLRTWRRLGHRRVERRRNTKPASALADGGGMAAAAMAQGSLPADSIRAGSCSDTDKLEDFVSLVALTIILLVTSHVLHSFLKRLGQPAATSHMLAGMLLGHSRLATNSFLGPAGSRDNLSSAATMGRQLFMFFIGLETDIPYLLRSGRNASVVVFGGGLISTTLAGIISPLVHWQMNITGSRLGFAATLMLIFFSTASPILVRMSTQLKLTNSDVGRLAISSSLVNDTTCLLLVSAFTTLDLNGKSTSGERLLQVAAAGAIMAMALGAIRPMVRWLNRRNKQRRDVRAKVSEVVGILCFVIVVSSATEMVGYNSMMTCFLMGLLFPREGSTARTLVDRLTHPVHNLILPIYFGYTGMQSTDIFAVHDNFDWGILTVVCMSTLGKVAGTVAAAHYLKISVFEGVVVGFLLNVKGHIDFIIMTLARKLNYLSDEAFTAMLSMVVLNTLVAGPAVAWFVRRERLALKHCATGLERQKPEGELRMLMCVHGPREVPTILNLIDISSGTEKTPFAAYVMQLVELTVKTTTAMLYHQQEDNGDGEDDFGANHAGQINVAVDAFTHETGINVRQMTAVSGFSSMHKNICNSAEDGRVSIVVMPFHKFMRVDGRMVPGKEGVRSVNEKVLMHAPCTVGILVDRGLGGTAQMSAVQASHQVVAIFFSGPDDREAVAYGSRLAMHPSVSLTLVRFLPASGANYESGVEMLASKDEEVLLAINNHDKERQADEAFLSNFYTRFVVPGIVTYVEKYVENAAETVDSLREMEGKYSLFLVGRGGRGPSPLVMGLSDWEECPELGSIGDLLASSDFTVSGSVLVLQQHSLSKSKEKALADDEFPAM